MAVFWLLFEICSETNNLDDVASGLPEIRQLYEQNPRVIKELRAYMKEIKIADELGLKDVSAQLWENYRKEREYILNIFKEGRK